MRSYTPQPFFLRSWRDKHSVDLKSDDHSETVTQANKVIDINDNYDNDDDDDDDENSDSTKSKKLPVSVSGRHSVASTRVFNSVDDILKEFQSNKVKYDTIAITI